MPLDPTSVPIRTPSDDSSASANINNFQFPPKVLFRLLLPLEWSRQPLAYSTASVGTGDRSSWHWPRRDQAPILKSPWRSAFPKNNPASRPTTEARFAQVGMLFERGVEAEKAPDSFHSAPERPLSASSLVPVISANFVVIG